MNRKTLEELATANALGALEPDETRQLEAFLTHNSDARNEVAAFIDTAAAIAAAASPRVSPSAEQRARVLAMARSTPQKQREPSAAQDSSGYSFLAHGEDGWVETDVPGFRTKTLSKGPQPGYQLMLVSFDPGTTFGDHDHEGIIEELYMISGHLQTEGRLLGPGDFMRGEVGTHHRESYSPDGCVALLICRPALAA